MDKLQIESFLNFKFLSNLKSNPSKNLFAYLQSKTDLEKNEYLYDLVISDGQNMKKSIYIKKSSSFIWESDHKILFAHEKNKQDEKKKKEKYTIYYRYLVDDNKIEKAYEFPYPTSIHTVLSDGLLLLTANLTTKEEQLYLTEGEPRKDLLKELKKDELYEDICEIPFYSNGNGFTANKRRQLFLYDINTQKIRKIVEEDLSVSEIFVSGNLKDIYYTAQKRIGVRSITNQVYVYNIERQETKCLYSNQDYSIHHMQIIEDQLVVAASDMKTYGLNENSNFYVLKDSKLELLATSFHSLGNSVGSDARLGASSSYLTYQNKLYIVSTVDDHNELFELDLNGNYQSIYKMNGSIDGLVLMNKTFYIISLYQQKLQEIYKLDLVNQKLTPITSVNRKSLRNIYIAKPKTIIYKDLSHEVKGFILYPKDYDQSKKYPAILDIHGGPKTVYGSVYYHEMQVWANKGYFVFYANPRGSDGKGNEFADIRGKYGTIDYQDLMNFTDLVLKKTKAIDPNQLFVTGGSYGGFMTNWIVGHTDRFKAAATQRSISNWLSFHGTSDIGYYFSKDQTDGHPNVDTDKLWEQSPMKYALNIKTPLLFIHSDEDYRCPIEQAMQLYTILKEQGLPSKFVWFKGENHELSRGGKPQARLKRLREITDWFENYKN